MSEIRDPDRDQQLPAPNNGPSVHDMVIEDLEERRQFGIRKYGYALQPGNGRDALLDAYEEVLDQVLYLRQLRAEKADFELFLRTRWKSTRAAAMAPGTGQWRDGYLCALGEVMRELRIELPKSVDPKGFFSWRDGVGDDE